MQIWLISCPVDTKRCQRHGLSKLAEVTFAVRTPTTTMSRRATDFSVYRRRSAGDALVRSWNIFSNDLSAHALCRYGPCRRTRTKMAVLLGRMRCRGHHDSTPGWPVEN